MYNEEKMHEVEAIIKAKKDNEFAMNSFATISGIRGMQFGKEVFATVVKFKDLMDFLQVFPEVQRNVNSRKVISIKNYVLTGIENPNSMRFFPAITVTARGHIFYSEANHSIAIDTNNSKLSINDGQHRFSGTNEALRELRGRLNRTKDEAEIARIKEMIKAIGEMILPMTIFNNLTEAEEMQLFHDANKLSQRPSRSTTIKLSQTDLFSIMAKELADENRYLKHYGVESDKASIHGNNPNTVLLTTIYDVARRLVWDETNKGASSRLEGRYDSLKAVVNSSLDMIFQSLPPDLEVKNKYLIEKNYTLKAIAKFVHDARIDGHSDGLIGEVIGSMSWEADNDYWKQYGASTTRRGKLSFGGSGDHARVAVLDALNNKLKDMQHTLFTLDEVAATEE